MGVFAAALPIILPLVPSLIKFVEGIFGKNKGQDKMTAVLAMVQAVIVQLQTSGTIPAGEAPPNAILQGVVETVLSQLKLSGQIKPTDVTNAIQSIYTAVHPSQPVTSSTVVMDRAKLKNVTFTTQGNSMSTESIFNNAYWLAQDPKVRALNDVADFDTRKSAAQMLATQGFVIDTQIMVWDWSPYLVMLNRKNYGFTWVPSLLGTPVSVAPGIGQPGTVPYDPTKPPPGSIKVSVDLADYPPFDPPAPAPVPVPVTSLVGIDTGAGFFSAVLPDAPKKLKDGQVYTEARGSFTFHAAHTPFGSAYYFTQN